MGSCRIENIEITVNALSAVTSCPKRTNPASVALIINLGVTHKEKIDSVPQMNLLKNVEKMLIFSKCAKNSLPLFHTREFMLSLRIKLIIEILFPSICFDEFDCSEYLCSHFHSLILRSHL